MIIKSKKIKTNLSSDSIFKIIELYFDKQYKITRLSDKKLKIKKLYKYQSNGWETILKQLSFKDSGYFYFDKNILSLKIDLTKHLVFWILLSSIVFYIFLNLFKLSIIVTSILIFVPIIIAWTIGIYNLRQFIDFEIKEISTRF
jgi:hypothetical protein